MNYRLLLVLLLFPVQIILAQQTKVQGIVSDQLTGEPMAFVKVFFLDSKIGTFTDSTGHYSIETYYATDSLRFVFTGYLSVTKKVTKDVAQEISVVLPVLTADIEEVVARAPDELPSTRLHKRVVANKPINNKEKLSAYEYELYNKIQFDANNIGENFTKRDIVNRLDLVLDYLDSTEAGETYLPMLLSETVSDFYFRKNPKSRREYVHGTRVTGIDNLQINQLLGDMYLDFNIYDNSIIMFNRSFISPVADNARNFYKFFLEDSAFIDQYWCYKLRFVPKRDGDLTFQGEMWIHDTTYAVKNIKATISLDANVNFVQGLFFEQDFNQVEKEVWMLTNEKLILDLKLTRNTGLYGVYARKTSSRRNFKINEKHPDEFYNTDYTVELADSAKLRDEHFWETHRHTALNQQESGIIEMIDSLNATPYLKNLKKLAYLASTGYYPYKKLEFGNALALISGNPVEKVRTGLALRTSNAFSRRLELGGRVAYGFGDQRFKYGATVRYNITPKKRGMLVAYYNYDLEQIGASPTAAALGSSFGTIFRTGPFDKLTFVQKVGMNIEKDVKKDFVIYGGFEWKEFTPKGIANYVRINQTTNLPENIESIRTSEFTARLRWAKNEEFIGGSFDRVSMGSWYPIISLQAIIGVKGLFGSDYNYQKIEFQMEHDRPIGFLGRIRYGINAGYIFGTAAYPFLKVHEGSQSYWLQSNAFNKLNFFEFVSDRYVGGFIENHWEGLFFDRIPLIKKLKWRLVTSSRFTYGAVSDRHSAEMLLPSFTKKFGSIPYVEAAIGIENIFQFFRVDLVYRATHLDPGMSPFGVRARWSFNF
ncbi:MAG: DUF5686 and carboxypeptidase regulatory-like domain-containing protein [Cryomorphaceae bacterium]|nr:DUF5686 and carboxypeptidase regulatory-like domain-containing protein [Cryomorphaceae bacterium]